MLRTELLLPDCEGALEKRLRLGVGALVEKFRRPPVEVVERSTLAWWLALLPGSFLDGLPVTGGSLKLQIPLRRGKHSPGDEQLHLSAVVLVHGADLDP